MLYGLIIALHIVVCAILIMLVLVQSDKGGGLAGSISGLGGVNTVFGGMGTANVLTKTTTWFAIGFMCLCIVLDLFVARSSTEQVKSILQKRAEKVQKMAPSSALPMATQDPSQMPIPTTSTGGQENAPMPENIPSPGSNIPAPAK